VYIYLLALCVLRAFTESQANAVYIII